MKKEKDKLTIWFLGSNSVGKTTQCAMLHLLMRRIFDAEDFVSQVKVFEKDGVQYSYTKVSPVSANLGVFNHPLTTQDKNVKTNACCGTDKLSTKAQIEAAYWAALADPDVKIITVDAIMATGQFVNFLSNKESKLMTVLLDCSEDTNFMRLAARRAVKMGVDPSEVVLSEKTRENLSGKLRAFRSTFKRSLPFSDSHLQISTDEDSIPTIHLLILEMLLWSI